MIAAIDVHAHLGTYAYGDPLHREFMSGDAARVTSLAECAGTAVTVVSALRAFFPEGDCDTVAGNAEAIAAVEADARLRLWAVLDPRRPESYDQVAHLLAHPRCAGIKIHPELHAYPIADFGQEIFAFAAGLRAVVQSHSGESRSMPQDFVPFADAFPEVSLIVSHLGFCWDADFTRQVRAIGASRHGNIYTDTSSSKSLTPNLIEWAVREVGAEKILYGTDSPLYFAPMQRARIDHADLTDEQKRLILRDNAVRVLGV